MAKPRIGTGTPDNSYGVRRMFLTWQSISYQGAEDRVCLLMPASGVLNDEMRSNEMMKPEDDPVCTGER